MTAEEKGGSRLGRAFRELNKRKVFQWMAAYLAGGFLALEGADQLVGYGLVPPVTYQVVLVFYLFGIPGTAILAWFHGERGAQKPPKLEIWLQGIMLVAALVISGVLIRNAHQQAEARESLLLSAAGGLDARSVAVTYFDDLTPGDTLSYLADGFTESLIEQLDRVRVLDVVSANGVRPFRDTELSRDSIAQILEVGTLVTGSVERTGGDRILISTNLVDGSSGATVDRMTVEVPSDQILAAQDSVAEQVARGLQVRIGEEIAVRQRRRATDVVEAWSGVQRATRLQDDAERQYRHGELETAIATFERADTVLAAAAEADTTWAEPLALRAHNSFRIARVMLSQDRFQAADAEIGEGIGYANRALLRSSSSAETYEARGNLRYLRYLAELVPGPEEAQKLLEAARADLQEAVRIDPTLASAHSSLSHMYYALDDNVNVVLAARKAYEEDAYLRDADIILDHLFWGHYDLEQFNDARRWCEEGYRRFPENYRFTECHLWLMLAPTVEPDVDRAWEWKTRLDSVAPPDIRAFEGALGQMLVGGILAQAGRRDSAFAVIDRVPELSPTEDPAHELPGFKAAILSVIGETDRAIRLLQQYVAANPHHSFTSGGQLHWWWRNLRDEAGFEAVRETGH